MRYRYQGPVGNNVAKNLKKIKLDRSISSDSSDDNEKTLITPPVPKSAQSSNDATQFSSEVLEVKNVSVRFNSEPPPPDHLKAESFVFDIVESPNLKLCKTLIHEVFKLGNPILDNQLVFDEILGQGQFGKVIRGNLQLSESESRPVCWKIANTVDINVMTEFLKEAKILAMLTHPTCVKSLGLSILADEGVALVTELLLGGDLEGALFNRVELPLLNMKTVFKMGLQLIEALQYLHGFGVIHRDIKPANILLTSALQNDPDIRLADFGGSFFPLVEQSDPGFVGTYRYMAPEVRANLLQDRSSDIYSVGGVLYELFSGKKVAPEPTPLDFNQYYECDDLSFQRPIEAHQNHYINTKRAYILSTTDDEQLIKFFQVLLPLHKTLKLFLEKARTASRVSKSIFHSSNLKVPVDAVKEQYGLFCLS